MMVTALVMVPVAGVIRLGDCQPDQGHHDPLLRSSGVRRRRCSASSRHWPGAWATSVSHIIVRFMAIRSPRGGRGQEAPSESAGCSSPYSALPARRGSGHQHDKKRLADQKYVFITLGQVALPPVDCWIHAGVSSPPSVDDLLSAARDLLGAHQRTCTAPSSCPEGRSVVTARCSTHMAVAIALVAAVAAEPQ